MRIDRCAGCGELVNIASDHKPGCDRGVRPDELPEAQFDGEFYRWTCMECTNVNDTEFDPRGEVVVCDDCQKKSKVES